MNKIWWLASYPKSGNTWIRMFFSAYWNGGQLNINRSYGAITDDTQEFFNQNVSPRPIDKLTPEGKIIIRPASLLQICAISSPDRPILVKTHFANCRIVDIPVIPDFLTNGAIYIIRDPRDVAVSFAEHKGDTIDNTISMMNRTDAILDKPPLFHALMTWSEHVTTWTKKPKFGVFAIRYEDILADPKRAFKEILKFTKHEVNEDLLDKAIEVTSFENLQKQEKEIGFREKRNGELFFARGKAGGWKDILTKEQAKQIETDHRGIMDKFGYYALGE